MNQTDRRPNDERTWSDWPICPECRRPRQSICPGCHTPGTDFLRADDVALAAPLRKVPGDSDSPAIADSDDLGAVLLLCPTCDEAFAPRFYRRCPGCGFDFGSGIDLDTSAFTQSPPHQVVLVLLGLLALGLGICVYLWWLLRS